MADTFGARAGDAQGQYGSQQRWRPGGRKPTRTRAANLRSDNTREPRTAKAWLAPDASVIRSPRFARCWHGGRLGSGGAQRLRQVVELWGARRKSTRSIRLRRTSTTDITTPWPTLRRSRTSSISPCCPNARRTANHSARRPCSAYPVSDATTRAIRQLHALGQSTRAIRPRTSNAVFT